MLSDVFIQFYKNLIPNQVMFNIIITYLDQTRTYLYL